MRVTFWGTRGSIPTPGPKTVRYGGNTSCVEMRTDDGSLLVFDCGTGAQPLGQALMAEKGPLTGHLFIGHTHWDHIQGFPFFAPLFAKGNQFHVYAPQGLKGELHRTLHGQMQHAYFPVSLDQLGAALQFHDLSEGGVQIGNALVTSKYLNHPAITLGYSVEVGGLRVVYATDHEPHSLQPLEDREALPEPPQHHEDQAHEAFLLGADLVIHDAQYTDSEYPAHKGWGHTTIEFLIQTCVRADVKRLALFHHDPARTDDQLDEILNDWRGRLKRWGSKLELIGAAEGQSIVLGERKGVAAPAPREVAERKDVVVPRVAIVCAEDPAQRELLQKSLESDGIRVLLADGVDDVVAKAEAERVPLLLLEGAAATVNKAAWALRSSKNEAIRSAAIIAITDATASAQDSFEAGATDFLHKPLTPQYIRSRAGAWLMRASHHWHPAPIPREDRSRVEALQRLAIPIGEDARYDRIARIAARIVGTPMAGVSFIDADTQWFKSRVGFEAAAVPRAESLCAHAILHPEGLVVPDLLGDDRFQDRPAGATALGIRFYAGTPLTTQDGFRVGTLCVMDKRPRILKPVELMALKDLAALAEELLTPSRQG